jgi:hypothetical protein
MTRSGFIRLLDKKRYSYEIEGDKIVILSKGDIKNLGSITSLPPGVEFRNGGEVWLDSLKIIPPGVEFNNRGHSVYLNSLLSGWACDWSGSIYRINNKRLLNFMISKGLFER